MNLVGNGFSTLVIIVPVRRVAEKCYRFIRIVPFLGQVSSDRLQILVCTDVKKVETSVLVYLRHDRELPVVPLVAPHALLHTKEELRLNFADNLVSEF